MFPPNDTRPGCALRLWPSIAGAVIVSTACGSASDRGPIGRATGPGVGGIGQLANAGRTGAGAAHAGRAAEGGAAGADGGDAGRDGGASSLPGAGQSGSANATGGAGGASAGDAGAGGSLEVGGSGDTVDLGPVPDPVCLRSRRWGAGTRLPLSTAEDDRLEGITPDGLTLVFASGGHFYVADRTAAVASFGPPLEVAAGLGYGSLTVSADGLRLAGARADGLSELTRAARGADFATEPDATAFFALNAAVAGTPTDEVVLEPLFAREDGALVYSFVSPSNDASRPTLFESEWVGQWPFGHPLSGSERLWASGQERRIATGMASDGLTLFYRDEVAGEFRAAWRTRLGDPFVAYASLGDLASAAPDGPCTALYYSAATAGASGLDLFVASPL